MFLNAYLIFVGIGSSIQKLVCGWTDKQTEIRNMCEQYWKAFIFYYTIFQCITYVEHVSFKSKFTFLRYSGKYSEQIPFIYKKKTLPFGQKCYERFGAELFQAIFGWLDKFGNMFHFRKILFSTLGINRILFWNFRSLMPV